MSEHGESNSRWKLVSEIGDADMYNVGDYTIEWDTNEQEGE